MNINIYKVKYSKNTITITINHNDYSKINKLVKINNINYLGIKKNILNIKKEKKSIINLFLIIILIILYSSIIIKIDVTTENKELKSLIINELDRRNIKKFTFYKKESSLKSIKEDLLNTLKDQIEWINIEREGMHYTIKLQQKLNKNLEQTPPYCHIVATKDATITRIISSVGMELVLANDSVKKDDILITGDISYNNEIKSKTCAQGTVYGKTWYTIKITIPKYYEEVTLHDNYRYNLLIKHNNKNSKIFKPRFSNYQNRNKKIMNFFGIELYLQKEYQTSIETNKYSEEEIERKIIELVENKMKPTLKGEGKILERKVLKKEENDSKIDIEIFIVAEEEIGTTLSIEE